MSPCAACRVTVRSTDEKYIYGVPDKGGPSLVPLLDHRASSLQEQAHVLQKIPLIMEKLGLHCGIFAGILASWQQWVAGGACRRRRERASSTGNMPHWDGSIYDVPLFTTIYFTTAALNTVTSRPSPLARLVRSTYLQVKYSL